MKVGSARGTLLNIPLIEEKYGRCFAVSVGLHAALVLFAIFAPYLIPRSAPIRIGTGPGGGPGSDLYSVGIADDLGGGAGMFKPSLVPQPPALPAEKATKEEAKRDAVALPDTVAPKKARTQEGAATKKPAPATDSNIIPTAPQPGAGGSGGLAGGSGGGRGGGQGVSIGSGSGGPGDSWYARVVESRIGSNWIRPAPGIRVEIIYSFFIATDGTIYGIKKEKSSGNEALDITAERAIRTSSPLTPPPPEFRGRPVQFLAQFVYPPTPESLMLEEYNVV